MQTVPCPICKINMIYTPRYPNEICRKCVGCATNGHGQYLRFYNKTLSERYVAFYADADGREEYFSQVCYDKTTKMPSERSSFGGNSSRVDT